MTYALLEGPMKAELRPWSIKAKKSKGYSLDNKSNTKAEIERTMADIIIFLLPKSSERTPDGRLAKLEIKSRTVFIRPNMRMETPRLFVM